ATARMVGLKIAEPRSLPASRLSGMKTQHSSPRRAACAATLLARLPVDAHAKTLNPSSTQRVAATETTRSLYEKVGWLTESSLMYSSSIPSSFASRSAFTSGVNPELKPVFGSSTANSSRYRHNDRGRDSIRLRLMAPRTAG